MKISFLQENLKRALATVAHAVGARSTLPVLSNVLVQASHDGRITLTATDLNTVIRCQAGGKIDEPGWTTIPAKLLADLVNNLPNDKIVLELDEPTQTTSVSCAGTRAKLKGIEADDFPSLTMLEGGAVVRATFEPEALRIAVQQVAFAAATDIGRPVLTGILMQLAGEQALFATTDGFRLAVRRLLLGEPAMDTDLIIPARAMAELARLLQDAEEPVRMALSESEGLVIFRCGPFEMASRLLEGKYPDYKRIIPVDYGTRTLVSTAELLQAVKRAAFFAASSGGNIKLMMEPGGDLRPGRLTLSANAAEVGENIEEVDALIEGAGMEIALNVRYLQDALGACLADQVAIETTSLAAPAIFKPVGSDEFTTLLMPMSIR